MQHQDVAISLKSIADFTDILEKNLMGVLGEVGVNAGMSKLLRAVQTAFDFQSLLQNPPSKEHVLAYLEAADLLTPYLKHTLWPDEYLDAWMGHVLCLVSP